MHTSSPPAASQLGALSLRAVLQVCRYSLLSMALGSLPLVLTGQGRDLLTSLGDAPNARHRVFFYLTLVLWGISVWYWSRVVLDAEVVRKDVRYSRLARELPRYLGATTILLPAVPIFIAHASSPSELMLSLGCVVLAVIFLHVVKRRRSWRDGRYDGQAVSTDSLRGALRTTAGRIAIASLIVSLLLFVWFVWAPLSAGGTLGAIAVVFIAAANTVFFGSLTVFVSRRIGLPLDALALVAAAFFSFVNDNHHVVFTDSKPKTPLPLPQEAFRNWLKELQSDKSQTPGGPVFVVAAEGGGIRAAYWTATVLSGAADAHPEFGRRLFAVSGISGGSLGAAIYSSLRQDGVRPPGLLERTRKILAGADLLAPTLAKLVTGDFAQWIIPYPVTRFDRSTAMEAAMAAMYRDGGATPAGRRNPFDESFFNLGVSAASGVPALILNSTGVQAGNRVILAPFTWRESQFPDATNFFDEAGERAPTLATAVHNSARFTYVSPAGRVPGKDKDKRKRDPWHVVDGGYFDPYGVDTLLDVIRELEPVANSMGVRIVPILVTNGRIDAKSNDGVWERLKSEGASGPMSAAGGAQTPVGGRALNQDHRSASNGTETEAALYRGELSGMTLLGEVFAPVRAILATRVGHGRLAIGRHRRTREAIAFGFCGGDKPLDPPLGWQLSVAMASQLDKYWQCPVNGKGLDAIDLLLKAPTSAIAAAMQSSAAALPPPTSTGREIIFFPTYGYREGADWVIPLRVKAQLPVASSGMTGTIRERLADFFARDDPGQDIRVRFDGDATLTDYRISIDSGTFPPTDVNGIVEGTIRMTEAAAQQLSSSSTDGWLTFRDATAGSAGTGRVRLISGGGISVVSDIDDTIKVSEVPANRLTLIANTFQRPFVAADGMSALYAGMPQGTTFHYVSGGPWQLYRRLSEFLIGPAGFPEGTFHMKTLSGSPGNPAAALKSLHRFVATEGTFEHKVAQITRLMEKFGERQFVLIGDSGECDPEIYRQIAGRFPKRVDRIIIRDVVNARVTAKQRLAGMEIVPAPTAGRTRCKH
jgi:hypothetical protein